jgi:hypothetical protein
VRLAARIAASIVAAMLAALLARPASFADDTAVPAAREEHFEWGKDVDGEAPIRTLQLRNDFGDIRARRTGERRLAVSAVIQRLEPAQKGVGVTVERRGAALVVAAAYPAGHVQDSDPTPARDRLDRLDFTVFVPEGVMLEAATLAGTIEARGLSNEVVATTRSGAITLATSGAVHARTESGDVMAILSPAAGVRRLRLESDSGAISVSLPEALDLEIRAGSTGAVTGELFFKRRRVGPRTYAEVRLGHGGRTLYVFSESGSLDFTRFAGPPPASDEDE